MSCVFHVVCPGVEKDVKNTNANSLAFSNEVGMDFFTLYGEG